MLMCFEFSTFNPVSFKIDFLFSRHIRNHVQKAAKAAEDEYDKQNTKKDSQYGKMLILRRNRQMYLNILLIKLFAIKKLIRL